MIHPRLVRHLAVAVTIKLAILAGLWWLFVRDLHVRLDPEIAAAHLIAPGAQRASANAAGAQP